MRPLNLAEGLESSASNRYYGTRSWSSRGLILEKSTLCTSSNRRKAIDARIVPPDFSPAQFPLATRRTAKLSPRFGSKVPQQSVSCSYGDLRSNAHLPPYPTEALCVGYVNGCNRAKIGYMKRQLIALALILAIGLQGSLAAFAAGIPVLQSDCQTSAESQGVAANSCCPSGVHTTNCCLDTCVAVVAVTASPVTLVLREPMVSAVHFRAASFFSRGDSPLIRPPIL